MIDCLVKSKKAKCKNKEFMKTLKKILEYKKPIGKESDPMSCGSKKGKGGRR